MISGISAAGKIYTLTSKFGSAQAALSLISVSTPPSKTAYTPREVFDTTGSPLGILEADKKR